MNIQSYLDEMGVAYRLSHHPMTYTAQDLAAQEHIPGRQVIKPVVVQADGEFLMCALPASHRVDLNELRAQLQATEVRLVPESKLAKLFPDCELGATPPIGAMYGMTTLMDESIVADDRVTFQAGTHDASITLRLIDFRRVSRAEIAHFGRHV